MKTIKLPMQVFDSEGHLVEERMAEWKILSEVAPGSCVECGRAHALQEPHDAQRMLYQYNFYADHGRFPTWKDALAHCAPNVQAAWEVVLREKGVWIEAATTA